MKLNNKEVNAEIAIREVEDLNKSELATLANLYIVRQHLGVEPTYERSYSKASSPVTYSISGDSEFLQTAQTKDLQSVMDVMDELMDTLMVVNRKVYDSVMRKIENI